MSVLLSSHMKNRANHLLAFLALCDMLVFIMMLPHYMASLNTFSLYGPFRVFNFYTKAHFGALTNWFSAAAIWFVFAVSVERLLIIKFPFRSLDVYDTRQIASVSLGIFVSTLMLTSYHHFSHVCISRLACRNTQVHGMCAEVVRLPKTSNAMRTYIEWSLVTNTFFAVLIPVTAVALLNISLIRLVKRRNTEQLVNLSAQCGATQEQERRVTHSVLAIITCFTLTQGPSALIFLLQYLHGRTQTLAQLSIFANELVLTGKMLNVVLFCLTSATFRRKLLFTLRLYLSLFLCLQPSFSRTHSKSVMTAKTSFAYSPSAHVRRLPSCVSEDVSLPPNHQSSPLLSVRTARNSLQQQNSAV
ncbi:hypothetical protein WR25_01253 isoform A [Diploscapter pachys]|uniref:G-protein coupled receptors family 1 profile domain-containing protein n=2 Tax=Diploscapter pachys TaxID=2018661 RepID=A0A2A2LYH2_9BILA|nr:hypothetical protein WR25_01253 isoform A [Diploscapter pachys]